MNFSSEFFDELHFIWELPSNVKFHWISELDTLVQQNKTSITKDVT